MKPALLSSLRAKQHCAHTLSLPLYSHSSFATNPLAGPSTGCELFNDPVESTGILPPSTGPVVNPVCSTFDANCDFFSAPSLPSTGGPTSGDDNDRLTCLSWGDPHIESLFGLQVTCSNPGSDCGFVPLVDIPGLKVSVFNERYYTNSWVTIQTQARVEIGEVNNRLVDTLYDADVPEFPAEGIIGTGSMFETQVSRPSVFDSRLELPNMGVSVRIWRLANSINNYLNIEVKLPKGPEIFNAQGICAQVRAGVSFFLFFFLSSLPLSNALLYASAHKMKTACFETLLCLDLFLKLQGCLKCEGGTFTLGGVSDPDQTFDPTVDVGIPDGVECGITMPQAQLFCSGLSGFLLDTCLFDVLTTCDSSAAQAALSVDSLINNGDPFTGLVPVTPPPVVTGPTRTARAFGDPHIIDFDVRADCGKHALTHSFTFRALCPTIEPTVSLHDCACFGFRETTSPAPTILRNADSFLCLLFLDSNWPWATSPSPHSPPQLLCKCCGSESERVSRSSCRSMQAARMRC